MKQQINLYQAVFHPKKNHLPARRIATILGVVSLALLLVYAVTSYEIVGVSKQLKKAQREQGRLAETLAELQAQLDANRKSELLEQEVERLEAERRSRQPLVEVLASEKGDKTFGFSAYLRALARQGGEGLWLRRIVLGGDGRSMILEGSALNPELVPRYLRRLAKDGSFAGLEFTRFQIERPRGGGKHVDFRMETHNLEESHEGAR